MLKRRYWVVSLVILTVVCISAVAARLSGALTSGVLVVVGLVAVFGLALTAFAVAIWTIPTREIKRWRSEGITGKDLAELGNAARASMIQALGGLALVATLAITTYQVSETRRSSSENLRIAEEGQVTERLSRAVDQLGARYPTGGVPIDIRVGGVYSLSRIGIDSERDRGAIIAILTAYVKNNLHSLHGPAARGEACSRERKASRHELRPDVEFALRSLTPLTAAEVESIPSRDPDAVYLVSDLAGANFADVSLTEARFTGIDFEGASFRNADLSRTAFEDLSLTNTDFRDACLEDAYADDMPLQPEIWNPQ
jgi:uncharacterized membrane protein YhaH (DUF805 family)